MFTGIIESEGKVLDLQNKGKDLSLTISYDHSIFDDISLGESISVNGICLTVESFTDDYLCFHLSLESISKVAKFKLNQKVNLERSLKMNDRISGHFVFGHVDGIASVEKIIKLDDCEQWFIKISDDLMKYIAVKGSISLNGVSLTINSFKENIFSINLIPHTIKNTTFQYINVNETLNIEIDMLARYIETVHKLNTTK